MRMSQVGFRLAKMLSPSRQLVVKPTVLPFDMYSMMPPPWPKGTAGTVHKQAGADAGHMEMLEAAWDL